MSDLACRSRFSIRKAKSWFRQAQPDKVFRNALKVNGDLPITINL
jgi:hypothetical protein